MTVDLADVLPGRAFASADAVEDVLATAEAWRNGELPLGEAVRLMLLEPRAVGTAFNAAWSDPRRPALEALHAVEFAQREDEFGSRRVYTNFGWLSTGAWDQVSRHMRSPDCDQLRYRRKAS